MHSEFTAAPIPLAYGMVDMATWPSRRLQGFKVALIQNSNTAPSVLIVGFERVLHCGDEGRFRCFMSFEYYGSGRIKRDIEKNDV